MSSLSDALGRPLRDLRISVTDRCNLRCTYCMPREVFGPDYAFLPREELLTFEEIERLSALFAQLGVRKLRLTGGEPLLRRDLPELVARLARIRGIEDIALTTNGLLLPRYARALRAAGLKRVTVSLDSLDPDTFGRMNGMGVTPERVLEGIAAAAEAGLKVKVNTVVQRGLNDAHLLDLARRFRDTPHALRFIEFMDVGETNRWQLEQVVPSSELAARLAQLAPLEPLQPTARGEVARRYRYADGRGEVGFISSVTAPFCGDCSRARLSSDGLLYTCLFAGEGFDLKALLRGAADDEALLAAIRHVWEARDDRYSELRAQGAAVTGKIEMSRIGG
ncbi:cyclic pyranopterin phosphate synthase [Deinobacterium chartae]|uniref:GTP 3',8-cyclase n=1 Tax=Deinobacterium chartae TaxID=521158 RepID=A0A841HYG1_9DEIO|nr:GTP 3',8-cyclase MoaA [Deinobacterium chartae]MBB6098581.1 cyclic pyranopterin phosphate synthase [Deinobacterium chartae]